MSKLLIRIELDEDKCEGCGICVEKCPVEMYVLKDGKSIIVRNPQEDCELCRMCESECPQEAIRVIEEYV